MLPFASSAWNAACRWLRGSNESGRYLIGFIEPGLYNISVEAAGFKLEEAADAHHLIEKGHHLGRIVLRVSLKG